MPVEFGQIPPPIDTFILWDILIISVIISVVYILRDKEEKPLNSKVLNRKLKAMSGHSLKLFALNLLIGWVVMIILLFVAYKHDPLFENNSFTVFWDEYAFSFISFALPLFVGMTTAILKFMTEFIKLGTDYE